LFEHLGDAKTQQSIREANPGVKHCDDLLINPHACSNCPHNPIRKREKAEKGELEKEPLEEQETVDINIILNLYDAVDMGLIGSLKDISTEDWVCLRIVHSYYRTMGSVKRLL
jgi:hypothetical protein